MRKRWKFRAAPWIALWIVGGLTALFVIQGLTGGCLKDYPTECGINGPPSKPMIIEAIVWLGPFVLFAVGYIALVTVPAIAMTLWEARPRRIEEPVLDDLREMHPPH